MSTGRSGTEYIKTALVRQLRNGFQHERIVGLDAMPLIIQDRPISSIDEPYIYLYVQSITEADKTKDSNSYDHFIGAQVVTRVAQNSDSSRLRDQIVEEVTRVIDVSSSGYIDLSAEGYEVYIQTIDDITLLDKYEEQGATYFQANVIIMIRAIYVGTTGTPSQRDPQQANRFTFNGFEFAPSGNRIEFYDAGTITPATTYSSPNNGWNFDSTTASLSSGVAGTYDGGTGVYTVGASDSPLGLDVLINYTLVADPTQTFTLNQATSFPRIRSVRYGTTTQDSFSAADLADLDAFSGTGRTIRYGRTNPAGLSVAFNGNVGDRFYIVHDPSHPISSLTDTLGTDNVANFTQTTVDGWTVWILTNPLAFDNFSLNLTIG